MIFEAPKKPTPWQKAERAAGWVVAISAAVGGVAVAAKAVVDYLEAKKGKAKDDE